MSLESNLKFTIDRSKWRFGGESFDEQKGPTYLLNEKGYYCCLGMIAEQCGVSDILSIQTPVGVEGYSSKYDDLFILYNDNNSLSISAMNINDNESLSNEGREQKLYELFKEKNIELEFVGEY